jgi:DNA-binding NarL/FixJ family response regulator
LITKRRKKARQKMSSDFGTAPAESSRRLRGGAFDEEKRLTKREREILGLFAEGLGTDAISSRLGISRVTVRNHSQRILAKLGVHSRLAAVARGRRDGMLDSPNPGASTVNVTGANASPRVRALRPSK